MTRKVTTITTEHEAAGMDDFWLEVERVGRRKISLTDNGTMMEVTARHAILQKLVQSSLQGSPQSIRQANALFQDMARRRKHEIETEVANWTQIKAKQTKYFAAYYEEHDEYPLEFPHPEDIEIDPTRGVRLRGPCDIQEHHSLMHTRRFIEACLLQDALDQQATSTAPNDERDQNGMLLLAGVLNHLLPPRMRLDDTEFIMSMNTAGRVTKRTLLKQTREAWQALGYDLPRGWTTGPMPQIENLVKIALDAVEIRIDPTVAHQEKTQQIGKLIYEAFG